ncbi:MAG TPA: hypothetical protein VF898_06990 [Chloroflexota bacterium]
MDSLSRAIVAYLTIVPPQLFVRSTQREPHVGKAHLHSWAGWYMLG